MSSVWEQLMTLRGMTESTGAIHEAQILQLKYWIRLAVPHAVKYADMEISVPDEDGTNDKIVRYHVQLPDPQKKWLGLKVEDGAPKNFSELLQGLIRSVHDLLGPDWKVEIYNGDKILLNGPRLAPTSDQFKDAIKKLKETSVG